MVTHAVVHRRVTVIAALPVVIVSTDVCVGEVINPYHLLTVLTVVTGHLVRPASSYLTDTTDSCH